MATKNVLAFDLGASSGRGMLARFDGEKITLEEKHRFPHNFSILIGHAYWDILHLADEIKHAIMLCKEDLSGIGFDTWGVDCGLLDREGNLLSMPGSYRDAALDDVNMAEALEIIGGERYAFEQTGIVLIKLYAAKTVTRTDMNASPQEKIEAFLTNDSLSSTSNICFDMELPTITLIMVSIIDMPNTTINFTLILKFFMFR